MVKSRADEIDKLRVPGHKKLGGARISEVQQWKLLVWHHFWSTGSVREGVN